MALFDEISYVHEKMLGVTVGTTKNFWCAGVHRLFFPVVVKICEFAFHRKNACEVCCLKIAQVFICIFVK